MENKGQFIFCAFLLLLWYGQSNAQEKKETQIIVSNNVVVGSGSTATQLIEPHVTAHPTNPKHLIAVGTEHNTRDENESTDTDHCVAFLSLDGGLTWAKKDLPAKVGLDSWISLTDKVAVLTTLGNDESTSDYNEEYYQLLTYFSTDGGTTWSKAQSLGYAHDGPRSTVGIDGSVYLTSHQSYENVANKIFVAKLRRTNFMEKTTSLLPSYLNQAIDGITTFSDGTLAISYQDFQKPISGSFKDANGNWRGRIKTRRQWLITSEDQGHTFSAPRLISERYFDRANDLVADKSNGEFNNRLYCIGSSLDYKSLLFTYSDDQGKTWTDEIEIESPELNGIRKEPQLAINKDGVLAIAWFDSRDYGENDYTGLCYNTYLTISTDGGKTFSKAVKVSTEKSCVNPEKAGAFVARRWRDGGDYFGLTASADGKFHVVWPDARNGKFELMTSSIEVKY